MSRTRLLTTAVLLLLSVSNRSSATEPRTFVVGLWPNRVGLFDEETQKFVGNIQLRYGAVTGYGQPAHTPDFEKVYYITDRMEAVEVVSPRLREVVDEVRLSTPGRRIRIFSISPDPRGKLLYLRVSAVDVGIDRFENEDIEYVVYDLEAHQVKESFRLPPETDRYLGFLDTFLFSGDGSSLFLVGKDIFELRASDRSLVDTMVLSQSLEPGFGAMRLAGPTQTEPGIYQGIYRTKDPVLGKEVTGVFRLDLEKREIEHFELGPAIRADAFALTADGRYAYAGLRDLVKIDMGTRKVVAIQKDFEQGRTNNTIILSADETKLYVTGVGDQLVIVDAKTLERTGAAELGADITSPPLAVPRIRTGNGSPP